MLLLPRARRAVSALVLVAFVGAESGCSWIFMKKEPPLPIEPTPPVECTSSRTAPTLDTIMTVATGLTAGLGLAVGLGGAFLQSYDGYGEEVAVGTWLIVAAAALAATVPLAFSASYGSRHAKECERLKSLQAACVSGDQDACAQLRGAQPGPSETPVAPPAEPVITPPAEVWIRDAAGLTSARLWPAPEQDR